MCGWNIHSSLPERQNFSTLLVAFRWEMNLLSPRSISFFFSSSLPSTKKMFSLCFALSLYFFFLYFHGVKTDANGANSKVTGVALFRPKQRQRLLFAEGGEGGGGCHTILIEILLSCLFFFFWFALTPFLEYHIQCSQDTPRQQFKFWNKKIKASRNHFFRNTVD